jgi:sucrose-phosphate synthase
MAELPGLKRQPRLEQSEFKLSYYIDLNKISPDQIKKSLYEAEQSVHVQLSFDHYIDILPIRASKGLALRYVMDRWQVPLAKTFVAGGAGADEDMMRGNPLAAVVANRHHEELSNLSEIDRIYYAEAAFEKGILEALDYYDFFGECVDPKEVETREVEAERDPSGDKA